MLANASWDRAAQLDCIDPHQEAARPLPSDLSFCLTAAVACAVLAVWPLLHHGALRTWPSLAAIAFLLIGLLRPRSLHAVNALVFRVSQIWGRRVMTPVVAGVLYYVLFTPVGVIRRTFRLGAMKLRVEPDLPTYWIERPPAESGGQNMLRQF